MSAAHGPRGASRISTAVDYTAIQVLSNKANTGSLPGEIGKYFNIVAACCKCIRCGFVNPTFDRELPGVGFVWREGVGLAVGHKSGSLCGLLRGHTEEFHVEQHLNVRLILVIATWCTERHD